MGSHFPRIVVIGVASLVLAACGGGDGGGPTVSDNTVVASVAPAGAVSVYLNKSQSVSITFASSDGRSASALSASGLASLPAGWAGPAGGFECPAVGTGGTCTLTLQYLPTAPATGTLVLAYSYRANNGATKQGSVSIDYSGLSPTLELLAGSIGGAGSLDGTASEASFLPVDVAVDASGTAYVVDGADVIRRIALDGMVSTLAGVRAYEICWYDCLVDGAGPEARFYDPAGVAVGPDGMLYVTDSSNRAIRRVDLQGETTTIAGGTSGTNDGTGASAQFLHPGHVAVDAGGNLHVIDSRRIRKVTPQGVVTTHPASQFLIDHDGGGGLGGLAVDGYGVVYVSDGGAIRKIMPDGTVTILAGSIDEWGHADGAGAAARFALKYAGARDMVMDRSGNLYVTDYLTIRRVTPDGVVTTLAGNAEEAGSGDGVGTAARFSGLAGIDIDSHGSLYVTDFGASTIRKVTPEGVVTTLAGKAAEIGDRDGIGSDARFRNPDSVAIGRDGAAFVATERSIRRVRRSGQVTTLPPVIDPPRDYQWISALGLDVDRDGNLWLTDEFGMIHSIAPDGVITTFGDTSGQPYPPYPFPTIAWGIAVGGDGVLYLGMGDYTIRSISPDRVVNTVAGKSLWSGYADGVGAEARFWSSATYLALDGQGNIYVGDCGNHAVRKVTPAGVVTTLAGGPNSEGFADGVGAAAKFTCPWRIAVDDNGTVFVTDQTAAGPTVRRITPDGAVTTVVGDPSSFGQRLGPLPGSLQNPRGLAVTEDGQLIITDGQAILITRGL
jgi:sugar lactone lactonase YvrE